MKQSRGNNLNFHDPMRTKILKKTSTDRESQQPRSTIILDPEFWILMRIQEPCIRSQTQIATKIWLVIPLECLSLIALRAWHASTTFEVFCLFMQTLRHVSWLSNNNDVAGYQWQKNFELPTVFCFWVIIVTHRRREIRWPRHYDLSPFTFQLCKFCVNGS